MLVNISVNALFHNTAWLNTSMLDGADPLDMIDLLATMPRGYRSNSHNGFTPHSTDFVLFGFRGTWGGSRTSEVVRFGN